MRSYFSLHFCPFLDVGIKRIAAALMFALIVGQYPLPPTKTRWKFSVNLLTRLPYAVVVLHFVSPTKTFEDLHSNIGIVLKL